MRRQLSIGGTVIYVDPSRNEHKALITAIWGNPDGEPVPAVPEHGQEAGTRWPCVNLIHVTNDESRADKYGRQFDRVTSVDHQEQNSAGGRCYRFPDEEPVTWEPPVQ